MPLTDTAARNAKPRAKPYKMADSAGLYLEVMPNGARYWRMRYCYAGKDTRLAFGVYPEVTLAEARQRRDAARAMLRDGRDPAAERKADKVRRVVATDSTFEAVAGEWLDKQRASLAAVTIAKAEWMLGLAVALNSRPISEITSPEVLAVLRKIESAGNIETAHRVKQRIGQIFRYAVATGRAMHDVTADLRGALAPPVTTSHAAITDPSKVGDLLRAIHGYEGQPATAAALKLAPLLFVRIYQAIRGQSERTPVLRVRCTPPRSICGYKKKAGRTVAARIAPNFCPPLPATERAPDDPRLPVQVKLQASLSKICLHFRVMVW